MQLAAGQMPSEHLSLLAHFQLAHSAEAGASPGLQPSVLECHAPSFAVPPAAARLTGGATSAWHDRNKTNLPTLPATSETTVNLLACRRQGSSGASAR